jgi:hypothetical protein
MSNEYFKIDLPGYAPLEVILVKPDDFLKVRETLTRIGVAIGDQVLDLDASARLGLLQRHGLAEAAECFLQQPTLNAFMSKGADVWSRARKAICKKLLIHLQILKIYKAELLALDTPTIRDHVF